MHSTQSRVRTAYKQLLSWSPHHCQKNGTAIQKTGRQWRCPLGLVCKIPCQIAWIHAFFICIPRDPDHWYTISARTRQHHWDGSAEEMGQLTIDHGKRIAEVIELRVCSARAIETGDEGKIRYGNRFESDKSLWIVLMNIPDRGHERCVKGAWRCPTARNCVISHGK